MKSLTRAAIASAAILAVSACASQSDIEELKKNQESIIKKLDELAKQGPARRPPPQRRAGPDASKTYSVPFAGTKSMKGPKDAWVTIVEVSDFQCPFCKRVNPTLDQVRKEYSSDVRIVFTHNALPFHKRAMPAANASECAGDQGKFWAMHDKIFENQRKLEDADLEGYAKAVGVDMKAWKGCYTANKHKAKIDQDQKTAASLGARGTPAFFINGRFISGAQPFDNFKKVIDEELAKAKKSGIPKADYYQKAVVAKGAKKI